MKALGIKASMEPEISTLDADIEDDWLLASGDVARSLGETRICVMMHRVRVTAVVELEPPRIDARRGLVLVLDARVASAAAGGYGPLVFGEALPPARDDGRSHLRAAPALVAALSDAWAGSGSLERSLNEAIAARQGALRRLRPFVLRGVRAPSLLVERSRGADAAAGRLTWSIPDVALRTNVARDVRLFARGTLAPELAPGGEGVRVRLRVDDVAVGCRAPAPRGVSVQSCLGEATTAVPDVPARLNRMLGPVDVLGDALTSLTSLGSTDGAVRLSVRPVALAAGTPEGEPAVDLTVAIAVEAQ